jgi:hypothetical protein
MEVSFNQQFLVALGYRAELWVAPDAPHTGAFERYADEHEQQVTDFFKGVLLE